jgi:hypothetical protein
MKPIWRTISIARMELRNRRVGALRRPDAAARRPYPGWRDSESGSGKLAGWSLILAFVTSVNALANPGPTIREYYGACDASAMAMVGPDHFVVADDEDNVLRVYRLREGGPPVQTANMTRFLLVDPKSPEADFEAAARLGERVYWVSSHGPNKRGRTRISRHQFFATTTTETNGVMRIDPVGRPYAHLLRDLDADPRLKRFQLARAAMRPPKSGGGLSIEGMAPTPEGALLLGFRNPIPAGRALIVPLLNPDQLIAGESARFGDPRLLDLGGLGVRGMTWLGDRYLIIAGSHDGGGTSVLYDWFGGDDQPRLFPEVAFDGLNPEAIESFDNDAGPFLFVISDDGTFKIDCLDCKELKDASRKRFRAVEIPL